MIRKCSWCGLILGAKCPDCEATCREFQKLHVATLWECTNDLCGKFFTDSGAPVTNGICEPCKEAMICSEVGAA